MLGDEETMGTSAGWRWKVGGRTTLAFGLGWERSDLTGEDEFDLWHASVEASHDLGSRTADRAQGMQRFDPDSSWKAEGDPS